MAIDWTGNPIKPSGYSYSKGTSGNPQFGNPQQVGGIEQFSTTATEPMFTQKPSWMTEEEWQQYLAMFGKSPQNYVPQGVSSGMNPNYDYSAGIGSQVYGGQGASGSPFGMSFGEGPSAGNFDMSTALKMFGG